MECKADRYKVGEVAHTRRKGNPRGCPYGIGIHSLTVGVRNDESALLLTPLRSHGEGQG
jgi:hypothetical protein